MHLDLLVSRYKTMYGLARYTAEVIKQLETSGIGFNTIYPHYPILLELAHRILKPFNYNIHDFFNIFPVSAKFSKGSVKHLTHQMMGSLLAVKPRMQKVIITVHDIVPYLMRDNPQQNQYRHFYDRIVDDMAMKSIRKADRIIAISEFTGNLLVDKLGCDPQKIRVILYGMDHEVFYPMLPSKEFKEKFKLSSKYKYLLYVGSENPRKNLSRLFQAFAKTKRSLPNIKLIKIGPVVHPQQYNLLQELIQKLKIEDDLIWINKISNDDLVTFYTFADAFVFPSLYEGFGLPPLEAMACETPVICSNASSLPEVTGNAAIQVDPEDVNAWTDAMIELIEDENLQGEMKRKGLERAAQFTWAKTVQKMIKVYQEVEAL